MAKEMLRYKVLKEADVYATGFQLKLRFNSTQFELRRFVEQFKDHPEYLAKFITVFNNNNGNER